MFRALAARRTRADVSLVTEVLSALRSARIAGEPIPPTALPVAIGLVNLHADVLASMPIRRLSGATSRAPYLERPNPDEDRFYTTHKLVQSAFWTGEAFALTAAGGDRALVALNPNEVTPIHDEYDSTRVASWLVNGNPVARGRVLHLKLHDDPRNGPSGRSPFVAAAEPLAMYGHAYRYLADFFAQGGNPSTVLQRTGPGNTAYTAADAVTDWITARQANRPAALPAGWELKVPPANGELEAIARILEKCAAEVARLVNTPPSLVNAPVQGSMTYSTVSGEFRRWLAVSLKPTWMGRLNVFYSEFAGEPVELDPVGLFDLVDPTIDDAPAIPGPTGPTRLEAVS